MQNDPLDHLLHENHPENFGPVLIWDFPEDDFEVWKELGLGDAESLEEYREQMARFEESARERNLGVLRIHSGVEEILKVMRDREIPSTPGGRARALFLHAVDLGLVEEDETLAVQSTVQVKIPPELEFPDVEVDPETDRLTCDPAVIDRILTLSGIPSGEVTAEDIEMILMEWYAAIRSYGFSDPFVERWLEERGFL